MKQSSDRVADHLNGNGACSRDSSTRPQKQQLLLRFLSSDDCESSQSIFSSSSHSDDDEDGDQNNHFITDDAYQGTTFDKQTRVASLDQPIASMNSQNLNGKNAAINDSDFVSQDENGQLNCVPAASGAQQAKNGKVGGTGSRNSNSANNGPHFFSSNAQNIATSSTFYGQKPQAMLYQSLDQRQAMDSNCNSAEKVGLGRNTNTAQLNSAERQKQAAQACYLDGKIDAIEGTDGGAEMNLKKKILREMPPMELASVRRIYSLKPDMAFGWRPEDIHGAPIPMHFDYEQNDLPVSAETGNNLPIYYLGSRFTDSIDMHRRFANKTKMLGPDEIPSYSFKFPPNQNVIDAMGHQSSQKAKDMANNGVTKMFTGMSPLLTEASVDQALPLLKNQGKDWSREFLQRQMTQLQAKAGPKDKHLLFDSNFESGNLDMAVQIAPSEFDMYMRVDSNTRGHHQWFYFKVKNQNRVGPIKFNFVNFTKRQSLYMHGMRVNVKSMLGQADIREKLPEGTPETALKNEGWVKCGANIQYKLSKLSSSNYVSSYNTNASNFAAEDKQSAVQKVRPVRFKRYYMLSFEYNFKRPNDEVYFAYALPYTFSKLNSFVKDVVSDHKELVHSLDRPLLTEPDEATLADAEGEQPFEKRPLIPVSYSQHAFIKESRFCYSLSGLEVPELIITSQVNKLSGRPSGAPLEIDPSEFDDKSKVPLYKDKKYVIVGARVHPGESNASYIMQGFLKFITGQSTEAINLRKRTVFRVIPMTNPDGVIAGNYRTSLSGNDLNRQFLTPNPKLHPTVDSIKKLCKDILANARQPDPIAGFFDIHGHSRKKSVFMYGPHYPLHNERYFKSKVLPKLLDDKTQMFRFYSCKFRIEKSKIKTARVVLFKDFGIMNCFTLEASFHGYIAKDRTTTELTTESLQDMGNMLGQTLAEYTEIVDDDERQKAQVREALRNKKRKLKARDINKAFNRHDKSSSTALTEATNLAGNQTDHEQDQAAGNPKLAKSKTMSVPQNNGNISTKVSSFSDTNNSDLDTKDQRQRSARSGLKHSTESQQLSTMTGAKEPAVILTSDIMELISEEELSVCRSEGSPPRKAKKGKVVIQQRQKAAIVDMVNAQAQAANLKKSSSKQVNKRVTGNGKGTGINTSANFKLNPHRTIKRLSESAGMNNQSSSHATSATKLNQTTEGGGAHGSGKKLTMQALMNQLKCETAEQRNGGSDDEEEDDGDDDDESSCGKSFSADELSEGDLKELQGDILGAIKRFDEQFNKGSIKEKYQKEKTEQRKLKKVQKEVHQRDQDIDKKAKSRKRREDLLAAAKNAQPAITMPFQVKGSGNGGNSCTLVMERIMQQRQTSQQTSAFMSTCAKKGTQDQIGFMQRHKKSVNSTDKEAYSRATTEINFNVPSRPTGVTNLEQNLAQKGNIKLKKRESSHGATSTGAPSHHGAPIGVKGLAAISDLRNSTKNSLAAGAEVAQKQSRATAIKSSERIDTGKGSLINTSYQRQTTASTKPQRLSKINSGTVTAKSPTSANGQLTNLTTKSTTKAPKTTKPSEGPKRQAAITTTQEYPCYSMPSLTGHQATKNTPKVMAVDDSGEPSSKTSSIHVRHHITHSSQTTARNLQQVQYQQHLQHAPQRQSAPPKQPPMTVNATMDHQTNDLDQPKIISMTLNISQPTVIANVTNFEYATAHSTESGGLLSSTAMQNANNYRVRQGKKRRNLSSQRCSSGNIAQRSKITTLAKENSFLQKANNERGQVPLVGPPSTQVTSSKKQMLSLKNPILQQSRASANIVMGGGHHSQYQSFVQPNCSSTHRQLDSQAKSGSAKENMIQVNSNNALQQQQPQFGVIGLATRNPVSEEEKNLLAQEGAQQQSASALAVMRKQSNLFLKPLKSKMATRAGEQYRQQRLVEESPRPADHQNYGHHMN